MHHLWDRATITRDSASDSFHLRAVYGSLPQVCLHFAMSFLVIFGYFLNQQQMSVPQFILCLLFVNLILPVSAFLSVMNLKERITRPDSRKES